MANAERDRLVPIRVSERRTEHDGNADGRETLGDGFVAAFVVFSGGREIADDERRRSREGAGEQELRAAKSYSSRGF